MVDGNHLRAEFGRYLHEHRHTRWGMDAALMHVARIAYEQGVIDGQTGALQWVDTPSFAPQLEEQVCQQHKN